MIFDTHMHCGYSCDSHMQLADAIRAGAAQNIGIIITEHWDYDYPTNPEAFLFDIDDYFKTAGPLRSDKVLLGIEIGMQKHSAAADDAVAAGHSFDYVLGSVHCINRRDMYEERCYTGLTKQQVVAEFLEEAMACITGHSNFDAFAHIDYMCRYWPYDDKEMRLKDAPELFDKFLQCLISHNKPIEINTRRLGSADAVATLTPIYQRYGQLGGRYCTLGSDAHYEEHVGRRLDVALKIAGAAQLVPVYFKERKMQLMGGF